MLWLGVLRDTEGAGKEATDGSSLVLFFRQSPARHTIPLSSRIPLSWRCHLQPRKVESVGLLSRRGTEFGPPDPTLVIYHDTTPPRIIKFSSAFLWDHAVPLAAIPSLNYALTSGHPVSPITSIYREMRPHPRVMTPDR